MRYRVLLSVMIYVLGAGALTWMLGGVFKRRRPKLSIPIRHLRAAQAWYASRRNQEKLETEVRAKYGTPAADEHTPAVAPRRIA